jgi:hypothetical protein
MNQPGKYLYRCHSSRSAGALVSGKGRGHGQRLGTNLYTEFSNHKLPHSRQPTALISTSSRLIDTLQRAFGIFYNKANDPGERNPGQIWIAFMYVPDVDKHIYHHAEDLAKQYREPEPGKFRYEYLFEWEIPERYIVHEVSVETLMNRGFDMKHYLRNGMFPRTSELRKAFASAMLSPSQHPDIIGIELGLLVRCFGARAPVRQLAQQLLYDCYPVQRIYWKIQTVALSYDDGRVYLDFGYFRAIEDGIDTALIDWWLADVDFYDAYNEHCDWALDIEDEDKIEDAAIKLGL